MTQPITKRAQLAKLISRKSGATVATLQEQLEWQPHTIRAEISRLRKRGVFVRCSTSTKGALYQAASAEKTT